MQCHATLSFFVFVGCYAWSVEVVVYNDVIWNKIALLKVSLFAWRLLNNRLPTKDNLIRRGMTRLDSILCADGCWIAKTSNHLFLGCNFSYFLWNEIIHLVRCVWPIIKCCRWPQMQFSGLKTLICYQWFMLKQTASNCACHQNKC
jgi:hypothetical protein